MGRQLDLAQDASASIAPLSAPIISGLQRQGNGPSRAFRPDGTDDWLLVYTLEGTGFIRTRNGVHRELKPGDALLVAPHKHQDYGHLDEDSGWVNIWVHFRPYANWAGLMSWPLLADGVYILHAEAHRADVETELGRLVEVAHGPLRLRTEASMNALERVLIILDESNERAILPAKDKRVRKALEIVGERVAVPIDIAHLAKEVGLSRSQFTALFTRQMNMTPQAYVENVKMMRAAQMLQSANWSINVIASDTGFSSPFYFSTRFRRQFGVSPSEYRRVHHERRENVFDPGNG
jgi:AraC family transcriptional regulator, arabinose operon regulatory protein